MKKISVKELATVIGGVSNRQCLIDGILTGIGIAAGLLFGGLGGGSAAAVGGGLGGNSNGCFG